MRLHARQRLEDAAGLRQDIFIVGHVHPGYAALVLIAELVQEGGVLRRRHLGAVDEEGVECDRCLGYRAVAFALV